MSINVKVSFFFCWREEVFFHVHSGEDYKELEKEYEIKPKILQFTLSFSTVAC